VFQGRISYIAPAVDPNTHRLTVRAEIANADGALKPQMFATLAITIGAKASAPGVPPAAIIYEGVEARVWVVRPDESIELRKVRVGLDNGPLVEIASGLTPGEKIVTKGALFIDRAASGE
jgi:cobalt-zinc-cadmium efflux system membrane fusion protein